MQQTIKKIAIGCIADDYTGAGDAASFLVSHGLPAVLYNGIPREEDLPDAGAVVIALKSRSIPAAEAVAQTHAALDWLLRHGAQQLYLKYCSTFDSTPRGNIGPVADHALEMLSLPYTVLCPALPVNGRTVRGGTLYVNGVPLDESPMRHHPLNPMWSGFIPELMEPQSKYPCLVLSGEQLTQPAERLRQTIAAFGRDKEHFYVVPDYENEQQAEQAARLFHDLPLLTGGSDLIGRLGAYAAERIEGERVRTVPDGTEGRAILLAGSCSTATTAQIAAFQNSGGRTIEISPRLLAQGELTPEDILKQIDGSSPKETLVYSSRPDGAEAPDEKDARRIETFMTQIALRAYRSGYRRFIVAGGETSGAVMQALGFQGFSIGSAIAPGVPVMTPLQDTSIRLVLKSGNFGQEDFFERALRLTKA